MQKTNPQSIILIMVMAVIVIGSGVYFWQKYATIDSIEITYPSPYENSTKEFTIVIPTSWGKFHEEMMEGGKVGKIYKTVRLTTENDSERFIQIQIVKTADKNDPSVLDHPQTYITGNSTDSYYYIGGGDFAGTPGMEDQKYFDIQNEVKEMVKTFKLIPIEAPTVVTTPTTQKSLEEYFATRNLIENKMMVKDPDELGLKEWANVEVTCPDGAGTPCAGNLLILTEGSSNSFDQEFYLAFTMGTGYTYYGPFMDGLKKIVDEAKTIESFERSDLETEVIETEISYVPSQELNEALDLSLEELRMSLFRGDAELAPTYAEFMTNVNKARETLEDAIFLYQEESKDENISDELKIMFKNFGTIHSKLLISLQRGDAELAPTYEEFSQTVRDINKELADYIEAYKKL